MKNYTITVNGNVYDVTIEENGTVSTPSAGVVNSAPKVAPISTPVVDKMSKVEKVGSIEVKANIPGKVFKIEASAGQSVNKGDNLLILEAMKMEIPVVAPEDGTVLSINVAVGASVETGDVLASLK